MAANGVRRALAVAIVAALVAVAIAVAGLDLTGRLSGGLVADPAPTPTQPLDPPRRPAAVVLSPEPSSSSAPVALDGSALDRVLAAPELGGGVGATVLDVATGTELYTQDSGTVRTPASVAKLATAAAVLTAYPPTHRFVTEVYAGSAPGEVVLVGGGDATLSNRRTSARDPRRTSLRELADRTADSLTAGGGDPGPVSVRVDDSLFAGPTVSPEWRPSYVPVGVVAPVTALMVDGGRVRRGSDQRAPDPALAAGRVFARLLAERGLRVAPDVARAAAPTSATVLASVESPTAAEMAELMLQNSDNDLGEALARLAAIGAGGAATFEGGAAAIANGLGSLGLPTDDVRLLDGSGLARRSRIAPATLAALLRLAVDGSHPELSAILEGLPVAGFSGTLSLRFESGVTGPGAGLVRAKTGTLTGVSSLVGVTAVAGRPVVFAVLADGVPADAALAAREALDRFAALLTGGDNAGSAE